MTRHKSFAPRGVPLINTYESSSRLEGWLIPGKNMREFCDDLGFTEAAIERHRESVRRH